MEIDTLVLLAELVDVFLHDSLNGTLAGIPVKDDHNPSIGKVLTGVIKQVIPAGVIAEFITSAANISIITGAYNLLHIRNYGLSRPVLQTPESRMPVRRTDRETGTEVNDLVRGDQFGGFIRGK